MKLGAFAGSSVVRGSGVDVVRSRERTRRKRLWKLFAWLLPVCVYIYYRIATSNPIRLGFPSMSPTQAEIFLPIGLIVLLGVVIVVPMMSAGKSPHVRYDPSEIDVTMDDVVGIGPVRTEVVNTLNLVLGYQTFRDQMGGNPRKAILFEGPPGTGKTYMAKAMAREAGVPYFFVSSTAFQSMYYGQTGRKIRNYFKELRKAAREEGGAIGFIEEIDAIGGTRDSLSASPDQTGLARATSNMLGPGASGMVNELLIQMQSFDQPPMRERMKSRVLDWISSYLPPERRIASAKPAYSNILLIAATNRADNLDTALLRPGRFDRRLYFDLPTKQGRRDLIDFFMDRKSHHQVLDEDSVRERLAHDTFGYTPVMIEHLFDESLLVALRDGRREMNLDDVYEAKLTEEIGIKQPVVYTDADRASVSTHEAGHATVAYFLGKGRRLEVLSIIKRRQSLGLLAHGDEEERFTRSRSEIQSHIAIALGGLVSEELLIGESGTGPASDLSAATALAAQMVGSFGMAGSLISYDAIAEGPIGRTNLVAKVLSDKDGKQRVEDILDAQKAKVTALLDENRDVVLALRDALIERDELVGGEILQVIEQALSSRS
jgi:ATP-dependent Zn protease